VSDFAHNPGTNWRWQNGYIRVQYNPFMPFSKERRTTVPYMCFVGGSCVTRVVTLDQACRRFGVRLEDAVVTP